MEKLRDELARNVFELDSGLIMIHHKYYVGHYSEHPYAIKLANETHLGVGQNGKFAISGSSVSTASFGLV